MIKESAPGPRLSGEDVEAYFHAGFLTRRKVFDVPEIYLEFDPLNEEIRLRTPAEGNVPELTGFERIVVETMDELSSGRWAELRVNANGSHYEAYLVLASVVDLMRGGLSFAAAISESVESFRVLLKQKQKMTDEAQLGLFGELLICEHALGVLSAEEVMNAWLGPDNEEHDFVFARFDAEVKTTRRELRVHLINSASQLEPTLRRPLYLLSVQVTAAGAAAQGRTLAEQITVVRNLLNPQLARVFDSRLERLDWRAQDEDYYRNRWVLRTAPRAYLVDHSFPAITTVRLAQVVPQPHLVRGVEYLVDVTNLEPSAVSEPLSAFVTIKADG